MMPPKTEEHAEEAGAHRRLVELGLTGSVQQADNCREGVSAFLEKRPPAFRRR